MEVTRQLQKKERDRRPCVRAIGHIEIIFGHEPGVQACLLFCRAVAATGLCLTGRIFEDTGVNVGDLCSIRLS